MDIKRAPRLEDRKVKIIIPLIPITKKNHQQIIQVHGRPCVIPSKQYRQYEKDCLMLIGYHGEAINVPCNIKAVFYMPTRRRCDLVNLQEAILDILVRAGVIEDDNYRVVTSMNGSEVRYDKENPRTEIDIEEIENPAKWWE